MDRQCSTEREMSTAVDDVYMHFVDVSEIEW